MNRLKVSRAVGGYRWISCKRNEVVEQLAYRDSDAWSDVPNSTRRHSRARSTKNDVLTISGPVKANLVVKRSDCIDTFPGMRKLPLAA